MNTTDKTIIVHLKNKDKIMSINGENWKQIDNTRYYVSNKGRVKNIETDTLLIPYMCKGYYYVHLGRIRKERVNRLVAIAFIPNPNNYSQVNHKDKNKLNNNIENLEWCNSKYNVEYSLGKKVVQYDAKTYKKINTFNSSAEAARILNLDKSSILKCTKHNKRNATVGGFIFRLINDKIIDDIKVKSGVSVIAVSVNNKDNIRKYNNIVEAAKDLNCLPTAISNCLRGRSKTCNGYYWKYEHRYKVQ